MALLSVVTPRGQVLEREVDEVTVPGLAGEFGVLDGHVAFISMSKPGVLSWRHRGERGRLTLGPGLVEVDGKGTVVVLVQTATAGEGEQAAQT